METLEARDLRDDMLKLVRYKVLFVRRDYEVAFPEREELLSENLTEDAFAAWKIAEFIQDIERGCTPVPESWQARSYPKEFTAGGCLKGIPHEDKKYLRIYYEVLDRYPREEFKYEEQQIRVLEQIKDRIGAGPSGPQDPYFDLLTQLRLSSSVFHAWRENFRRCAGKLGGQLAAILQEYASLAAVKVPSISAEEITRALTVSPYASRNTFNRFAGTTDSKLQVFVRKRGMPPSDIPVPPNHSWRGRVIGRPNAEVAYAQRVAESYVRSINPNDVSAVTLALAGKQLDLHLHACLEDVGTVSWSSLNQGPPVHMRGIAYEMDGKVLYFKQMLNADKTPLLGPMPSAPMVEVVPDQFVVAVEFSLANAARQSYATCAMPINFDFEKCTATFQGLVLMFENTATA